MQRRQAKLLGLGTTVSLTIALTACSTTVNIPPAPSVSFTAPGVEGSVGEATTLPADWPSDVPVPTQLKLKAAAGFDTQAGKTMTAGYEGKANVSEVHRDLTDRFKAAGFKADASFGDGSAGGISVWKKGDVTVQLTVAEQQGNVVVSESVVIANPSAPGPHRQ